MSTRTNPPGYETRDVSLRHLTVVAVASVLLLILILVGVREYFIFSKEKQIYQTVLAPPSPKLMALRSYESQRLNSYGPADEAGYYHIPIERAKALLLQEAPRNP